ncbi:MAG: hypothetical protein JOY90_07855 [Bradyrhizobium sp.]|uniref:hypothetical protein n=1 Tax=Bradyrhizobium sp. TaxID=376 RepID=UPI001E0D947D|nr:hypothetical protein [Bradyrhizobium sp.]MBV9560359.1 hypothetical protein [Bradyrhizobium sp.]
MKIYDRGRAHTARVRIVLAATRSISSASMRAQVEALPAVKNRSGNEILPEDLARFTA